MRGWGVVYLLYLLACALQYRYLNNMLSSFINSNVYTGADSLACIQLWSLHEQCHQLSGWGVVSLLYLFACALQYRYLNNIHYHKLGILLMIIARTAIHVHQLTMIARTAIHVHQLMPHNQNRKYKAYHQS
jgi:hypothetical protein